MKSECESVTSKGIFLYSQIHNPTDISLFFVLLVIFYLHNRDVWTCGKCFSKYGTWCGRSGAGLQCEPLDCIWQVSHVGLLSLVFDGLQSPDLEQETEDREAALLLFNLKKIWTLKSNSELAENMRVHSGHGRAGCELTEMRVSQQPCLWLRFHRLTVSWLSLLFLRSPWANRTANRERARVPWRRAFCCKEHQGRNINEGNPTSC